MNAKTFKILMILLPVVFIILLTALIITHISHFRNIAQEDMSSSIMRIGGNGMPVSVPPIMPLRSGDIINVNTSGTYNIFLHGKTLCKIDLLDLTHSVTLYLMIM